MNVLYISASHDNIIKKSSINKIINIVSSRNTFEENQLPNDFEQQMAKSLEISESLIKLASTASKMIIPLFASFLFIVWVQYLTKSSNSPLNLIDLIIYIILISVGSIFSTILYIVTKNFLKRHKITE